MLDKFNAYIVNQHLNTIKVVDCSIKNFSSRILSAAILWLGIVIYLCVNTLSGKYLPQEQAIITVAIVISLVYAKFSSVKLQLKKDVLTYNVLISIAVIMISIYFSYNMYDPGMEDYSKAIQNLDTSTLLLSILVLAPISEELFFRGFLFKYINKIGIPMYLSMIVSSSIFVAVHGTLSHIVPAFIMGMFFNIVYYYTGNIICSILCHCLYNLITLLISIMQIEYIAFGLMILYLIVLGILLIHFSKYIQRKKTLC